jgi:hypothetical protein
MYKQTELQEGLQKLVDQGVVLMEDDWTVDVAVGNWYSSGGDDVSDTQTGDGFSPVLQWFTWLWDMEYVTFLGDFEDDVEATASRFKELQPEAPLKD